MDSNYTRKFLRTKSLSESSETSSIGGESILSEIEMDIAQRNRSGSINSRDAVVNTTSGSPVGSSSNTDNKLENQLYDKYLAK